MTDVVVVDLGTGNLRSVCKALEHVAPERSVMITAKAKEIVRANHVVLPGQGAIGTWMQALHDVALRQGIEDALINKPVLGICLGLQALFERSEEDGGIVCLDILDGDVKRFINGATTTGTRLKIPHMGWNKVSQAQSHPLWRNIEDDSRFYFVHSYYAESSNNKQIAGSCNYGLTFTAAAMKDNIFAVQFHPEKSQQAGLNLMKNFLAWDGAVR